MTTFLSNRDIYESVICGMLVGAQNEVKTIRKK